MELLMRDVVVRIIFYILYVLQVPGIIGKLMARGP